MEDCKKKTLSNFYQYKLNTQITITIFLYFFQLGIKMSNKTITFEDKKVNKSNFYKTQNYLIYMT